jgi:threonine dehydratase
VLAGIQVGESDRDAFQATLDRIGYHHRDESSNPAYALFLGEAP